MHKIGEDETPLNTEGMSLVFVILSTLEVTIREVNSAVSDARGPRALQPLSEWKKHSCGHFKCKTGIILTIKGKAILVQAWTGPEGSRRLRLLDFKTMGT
jgi:hypothetical protein